MPALVAASHRRVTRGRRERQSPGFEKELAKVRTLHTRRLTRHPLDTRRTFTSQRLGLGRLQTRSRKEPALPRRPTSRGEHHADDDDILQRQFRVRRRRPVESNSRVREARGAGAKDGASRDRVATFVPLAQHASATVDDVSR